MNRLPLGFHLVLRAVDDRILTPDVASARAFARALLRFGLDAGLLFFGAAGTHGHAALICSAERAGRFAHDVQVALRAALALAAPFETHRRTPIRNQQHLRNTRSYIFENPRKHGVAVDPYLEASNVPDLLGLRVIGAYTRGHVRKWVPSVSREDLLGHLGIDGLGTNGDLRALADSAAAAIAESELRGRRAIVVRARVAAAHVGLDLGARPGWLADQLEVTREGLRRLSRRSPDEPLVEAIRRQLWLRERLSRPRGSVVPA